MDLIYQILDAGLDIYNWWKSLRYQFITTFKNNEFFGAIITISGGLFAIITITKIIFRRR